jgi:hypothetical protein
MQTQQENVFMQEFDEWLLRMIQGPECLPVNETDNTVDWLILMLSFIRYILAGKEVDLDWVQLLS